VATSRAAEGTSIERPVSPGRLGAAAALALVLTVLWPSAPALAQAPPEVSAAGAVLYDPGEDQVLYGKDENGPRLIASTTKMMTALLAIEAGTLDAEVVVSPTADAADATPGAATLQLVAGQRIPMRSLLAGLVLRSGNDAAVAVAEHVAGSEAAFVARMNQRAGELGMTATAFVDASGLTEQPGNRASPLDLARLAEVAMANPDFASWAGAESLSVPGLPPLVSRNELLRTYDGATGVKTGFTTRAGQCLVASATRGDRTLITVVLGSSANFRDSAVLLDHGFTAFRRVAPAVPERPTTRYHWADQAVDLVPAEPLDATIPAGATATWSVTLEPVLPRPAVTGTVAGQAELRVDGQVADVVDLRLAQEAQAPGQQDPAGRAGGVIADALRAFARTQTTERAA
jgi:D-alanyl-D-alanine carboxypeptidase (penicillin-binding protein 5/6)